MQLNVGAGHRRLPGWIAVDAVEHEGIDIVADARSIPLPDGCADQVMAIHLVEHLYVWDVPDALCEWYRLLKQGGLLILEMPDIWKACRNLLSPEKYPGKHAGQMDMWGIYGDPRLQDPYMTHKWGWTFETLSPFVKTAGFCDMREQITKFHQIGSEHRDFRLEARKPANPPTARPLIRINRI